MSLSPQIHPTFIEHSQTAVEQDSPARFLYTMGCVDHLSKALFTWETCLGVCVFGILQRGTNSMQISKHVILSSHVDILISGGLGMPGSILWNTWHLAEKHVRGRRID